MGGHAIGDAVGRREPRVATRQPTVGPVAPSAGLVAALDSEGLWQGFVAGLGGAVAADGKFALTAPKTVAAIQALVELVQAYAVRTYSLNCLVDSVSVRGRGHGEARARQRAATRVEWA